MCLFSLPPQRAKNNNIYVEDLKEKGEKRPVPKPCRSFPEAFERYPEIMDNIRHVGFEKPTPIQVWRSRLSTLTLSDCFYEAPHLIVAACEVVRAMTRCFFFYSDDDFSRRLGPC